MLKLKPKFDLHRDVVCDLLRKEASVCRVTGEAFRGPRSAAGFYTVKLFLTVNSLIALINRWLTS